jgi:hypothetical protein
VLTAIATVHSAAFAWIPDDILAGRHDHQYPYLEIREYPSNPKGNITRLSQSMRDRILRLLANNGGEMERAFLRRRIGWRYPILDIIVDELEKEGRIKIRVGKRGDLVSLISGEVARCRCCFLM